MQDSSNTLNNQQAAANQASTGNPQEVPQANPQSAMAQSTALQNAGSQSVEAINMLDQGSAALRVIGVNNSIVLPSNTSVAATVQPTSSPGKPLLSKDTLLYAGIGLAVVLCMAILAYGLMRPHHK